MFLELVAGTYFWKVGRTSHWRQRNERNTWRWKEEVGWEDLIHKSKITGENSECFIFLTVSLMAFLYYLRKHNFL